MEQIIKGMPDGAEAIQKNFAELMGKTQGQAATFKDFADVAADMVKYSGGFSVAGVTITNAPFSNPWYAGQVIVGTSEKTGAIVAYYFGGGMKVTAVSDGKLVGWHELATTDKAGLIEWQANMDVKKGQMITFSSLGDFATGKLNNPIFKAKLSHNTGSAFPNAAESSEYWELVNPESYEISAKSKMFYGLDARWYRSGDRVLLNVGGSFNADGINQIGSMTVIGDKVPAQVFYVANYVPGLDYRQVVVLFLNFNTHSDWHGQIKLGTNDPSIQVSTWLGNAQMNKSDNGDAVPVEYYADPSTRAWGSGIPTV